MFNKSDFLCVLCELHSHHYYCQDYCQVGRALSFCGGVLRSNKGSLIWSSPRRRNRSVLNRCGCDFQEVGGNSAEDLVVSESPFRQSRRGVLEQSIDWTSGMQGKIVGVTIDANMNRKKAATVALEATGWQTLGRTLFF